MTPESRRLRRAAIGAGVLFVSHLVLAYALDAMGLVESLLSAGGLRAILALVLGMVFYAVRLVLLFLVPGLLLSALSFWGIERLRGRTSAKSGS